MTLILCALLACCVPTCPTSMYDWDSCGISSIPPVSTQAGCGSTDPAVVNTGGLGYSGSMPTDPKPLSLCLSPQLACASGEKCGGAAVPGRGCAPADNCFLPAVGSLQRPTGSPPGESRLASPPCVGKVLGAVACDSGGSGFTPGLWELRCDVDTVEGRWVHGERWENLPCPDVSNQKRQDGYVIGATVEVCAAIHGKFVTDSTWITDDPAIDTTCAWSRHECAGAVDSLLGWWKKPTTTTLEYRVW